MPLTKGLEPVVDDQSRILILGTLPGGESLRKGEYYTKNSNQFWSILSRIHGEQINSDYESRLEFLHRYGIAPWDIIKKAKRVGSLDKNICKSSIVPNDLVSLIKKYPSIKVIGLKGRKTEKHFNREFKNKPVFYSLKSEYIKCSSSSNPQSFEEKVENWKKLFVAQT